MSGPEGLPPRNIPSTLQSPLGSGNRTVEEAFDFDHAVYVVWRPWEACDRCWAAYKADTIKLPEEGDRVCPHTLIKEYKELLKKRSQGLCVFSSHVETTLKNGTIQISVSIASKRAKETGPKMPDIAASGPPRPPVL